MGDRVYTMFSDELGKEQDKIHVERIMTKAMQYWPLFLISILISLLVSVFYLKYVTPIYKVKAKVLIKEEKKGGASEDKFFQDIGINSGVANVENEIEILKSRVLMQDVVRTSNLNVRYYVSDRFKKKELYKETPFNIVCVTPELIHSVGSYEMSIDKTNSNNIIITENDKSRSVAMGDTVQLSICKIIISHNTARNALTNNDITVVISPVESIADAYTGALEIEPVNKQVSIINLSIKDNIPARGEDVLNKLISVYLNANVDDKNAISVGTLEFIDERLKLVAGELNTIEGEIELFKQTNNITNITDQSKLLLDNTSDFNKQLSQQEIQLSIIESLERYLRNHQNRIVPSTLLIQDVTLTRIIERYNALQAQRQSLLVSSTEKSPYITNIDKELDNLRGDMRSNLASIKDGLRVSVNQINRKLSLYDAKAKQIPEKERVYLEFARKQAVTEELYLFLLKKREETAISKSSTIANARIIEPPHQDGSPFYPSKSKAYLVAIAIGLFLPGTWVAAKEIFNLKVKSREDVLALTTAPILAEIGNRKDKEVVAVSKNSKTVISEQFRALRTNLQFLLTVKDEKVILVTSSTGGEGKSFISINLASILSLTGKKVVLLELDLRKPKVSEHLNLTYKSGFSDYAIGKASFDDVIIPSGISDSLFIIPAGMIPPNPAELIMLPRVEVLFENLRKVFDYIIIDTPPLGLVTDAQLLSRYADTALYVVRQNYTYKQQVKFANEYYKNGKMPKMNIILNDVHMGRGSSYAYRYGYGNGYYEESTDKKSILNLKDSLKRKRN